MKGKRNFPKAKKTTPTKKSALTIAKDALKLAKRLSNSTSETKYLSYSIATDLAGTAGTFNDAFSRQLTSTSSTTTLYNADPLTGNKAFLKYLRGTWDIHLDNTNSEEETINITCAVVKLKSDMDQMTYGSHVSVIQGQAYYDPRFFKVLYYKHFTISMGGGSGITGTPNRTGSFMIPVNKMIRFTNEGAGGTQTNTSPASVQDQYYFVVHTDNTSADLENPRMNLRTLSVYMDSDINA